MVLWAKPPSGKVSLGLHPQLSFPWDVYTCVYKPTTMLIESNYYASVYIRLGGQIIITHMLHCISGDLHLDVSENGVMTGC